MVRSTEQKFPTPNVQALAVSVDWISLPPEIQYQDGSLKVV